MKGLLVWNPLYGGDGRLTKGVLRLEAESNMGDLGDRAGECAVMFSMERGEGLGLLPDLCREERLGDIDASEEVEGEALEEPAPLEVSGEEGGEDLNS